MTQSLPTLAQAKQQARTYRTAQAAKGIALSHADALEAVAHALGFRDWNGLHAAIAEMPPEGVQLGAEVTGRYLSQPFTGRVTHLALVRPGWFRVEVQLDAPVDVIQFDSMSNWRSRVRGVIGPDGHTKERTSDGSPHLELTLR
ncbi:hypothetical protein FHS89_000979 [Rubricella aquisinus]|uniref:Glyoxalase-related protein domain-containing protein n=1 Tax=Rubricella aquisinus TaxID=2028108 RepID=A0A840WLF1_9RHOB|nr:glyoxalase superfamily protein [Rubricella aquisinus]MBB5514973.1 hypothetical protein [Rubricella aquisinus]